MHIKVFAYVVREFQYKDRPLFSSSRYFALLLYMVSIEVLKIKLSNPSSLHLFLSSILVFSLLLQMKAFHCLIVLDVSMFVKCKRQIHRYNGDVGHTKKPDIQKAVCVRGLSMSLLCMWMCDDIVYWKQPSSSTSLLILYVLNINNPFCSLKRPIQKLSTKQLF